MTISLLSAAASGNTPPPPPANSSGSSAGGSTATAVSVLPGATQQTAVLAATAQAYAEASGEVQAQGSSASAAETSAAAPVQINKDAKLPQSHVCFNRLDLPQYATATILRQKLLTAITLAGNAIAIE